MKKKTQRIFRMHVNKRDVTMFCDVTLGISTSTMMSNDVILRKHSGMMTSIVLRCNIMVLAVIGRQFVT
jgi:hypothetical protein